MRLKRLELFGFKSFADRTVMDFGQTTLTGIVGPNGCGKSNVVDAVRWVLGETRPTSMRGSGMTDVIFKGSVSRPAMGTAEVTMVLDNSASVLPERGPEVSISRRLYASGEGEYLIDGQRVRLKDVKDLLFDTGLGSRGYSVLEQGRIDAVLSANPAQRRAIFEEAAGISRYRQRRHETELRLKRCEQDVERLEDVMGELRSRVRSLKIQAGKAEKYVVAKGEWTRERTRLLSHRMVGYDQVLGGLAPKIDELEQGLGELREQRAECDSMIEEREAERGQVTESLRSVGDEAARISGDLRALEERKSQLAMRIASWAASSSEEGERASALEAQLHEREDELSTLGADIEALRERAAQADERAQGLVGQSRELNKGYKELRQEVQAQNDRVLERLHERTAAENRVVHLTEALPPSEERLSRVVQRFGAAETQIATVTASVATSEQGIGVLAETVAEAESTLEATRDERATVEETLEERRRQRAERNVQRAGHQSRVEALLDRERELEDLSGGARRVLEAADAGDGPCRNEELLGLVADHLKADVRLARAIDAVLGDRAHALVARDAHAARRIVDWCASEEVGQVGVVIPPGVGAPDCPPPSDYALFARFGAGVEGRLGDLVRCDDSMRPLVHALFCDVVLVSSLDIALDLVGREPGWRFVTPRGELVDSAGIVGGYRDVAHGFVGRRSSAADLEQKIAELSDAIEADDQAIQSAQERIGELVEILKVQGGEREAARRAQAEAEATLSAARARLTDLAAAMAAQADERAKAEAEVVRVRTELEEAATAKEQAGEAFETENARLEQMEVGRRQLETEREDLQREEAQAQVELSSAKAELSGLEQRITSLERLLVETRSEIERSGTRAVTYENSAQEGRTEVAGIVVEAETLAISRQELEASIEELRERERTGAQRISETRRAAEAVQAELDSHGELLGKHRLEAQRADLARQEVVGRAVEELELAEHDLREAFASLEEELAEESELKELDKYVAKVKAELDRLGPVNVEAVHELEEVGGRLDHLETQSGDLAEARKTLLDTIKTIDEESRRLFLETFEEVRGNFQRIFRLLFGGGKADVRLEEGVDVLDAGVEIVARPPGRELLSIGLLSGGQRTMTALALLFAVFEARPSPFCVLDEVDAALDDANVDRFLGMLDGFRKTTQFIVVTHNKGTMAASQALYGVTMQVKGVSRFVAVELEEIDEFVPDTIGTAKRAQAGDGGAGSAASPGDAPGSPALLADSNGDGPSGGPHGGDPEARDPDTGEPIKEIPSQRAVQGSEAIAVKDAAPA